MKKLYFIFFLLILCNHSLKAQLDFWENFDSGTIPAGWFSTFSVTDVASCDNYSAKANLYPGQPPKTLITPNQAGVSDGTDITFSIDYKFITVDPPYSGVSNIGTTNFSYSTDDGLTWTIFYTLNSTNHTVSDECANLTTTIYADDVPLGSDIKFKIFTAYVNGAPYNFYIDNIHAYQNLACTAPSNLQINSISSNSVSFEWTNGDAEESWEYVVQEQGLGMPESGMSTTSTNAVSNDLTPSTQYEIWVRSVCGPGIFSNWNGPLQFYTGCTPETATYFQGFDQETAPAINSCWTTMIEGQVPSSDPQISSVASKYVSFPNSVAFYSSLDDIGSYYLISPEFSDLDANKRVKLKVFFGNINSGDDFEIGTMSDPLDASTFTSLQTYTEAELGAQEWVSITLPLTAVTAGDSHIAINYHPGAGSHYFYADNFLYEEIPSCIEPTSISLSNISSNGVTIDWTPQGTEAEWEYAIQPIGQGWPASGTSTTSHPVSVTDLNPSITYEVFVRAICVSSSEISQWSEPVSFTTECQSFTAPYEQNFDTQYAPFITECWSTLIDGASNTSGIVDLTQGEYFSPLNSVRFFNGFDESGSYYLISPQFSDIGTDKRARFRIYMNAGSVDDGDTIEVGTMSDASDASTFTVFQTLNQSDLLEDDWQSIIVPFTNYSNSDQFIAIRYNPGAVYNVYYVDDFNYESLPDCPEPTDVNLSLISYSSLTIDWTEAGNATNWEYVIQSASLGEPESGTLTTDNPLMVSGLTPIWDYELYIRAVCDPSDPEAVSLWSGPYSFQTKCYRENLNYQEDFSTWVSTDSFPNCWEEADAGSPTDGPDQIGAGSWIYDGYANNGIDGAARITLNGNAKNDWLISPLINLPAGGNYGLDFDMAFQSSGLSTSFQALGSDDKVYVLISTDFGDNWTIIETYDSSTVLNNGGELQILDISAYGGNIIQVAFLASEGTFDDTNNTDVFIDNVAVYEATTDQVDWANLQSVTPSEAVNCETVTFKTQAYEPGVTNASNLAPGASIQVWVGINTADTDPSTWPSSAWHLASYYNDAGVNDQFTFTTPPLDPGTYYAASRWRYNYGPFAYGASEGLWNADDSPNSELIVAEAQPITISASQTEICYNGTTDVTLTASSGTNYNYTWDNGLGAGATKVVSPTETTFYTVTGSVNGQCHILAHIEIVVVPPPDNAVAPFSQTFCPTDAPTVADLEVSGINIVWYDAASEGVELSPSTLLADNDYYYAQNINESGCLSNSRTAVVVHFDDSICVPGNDDCENADILTVDSPPVSGTTTNASGDTNTTCGEMTDGVWYQFNGDGSELTVNLNENSWDAAISVFEGDCTNGFSCIGDSDNSGAGESESVDFVSSAGTVYYVLVGSNSAAESGDFEIEVVSNLGVSDIESYDEKLTLYPNPVRNILNFNSLVEIKMIEIFSSSGQIVQTLKNPVSNYIDVSQLGPGVYILTIKDSDGKTLKEKFIKE